MARVLYVSDAGLRQSQFDTCVILHVVSHEDMDLSDDDNATLCRGLTDYWREESRLTSEQADALYQLADKCVDWLNAQANMGWSPDVYYMFADGGLYRTSEFAPVAYRADYGAYPMPRQYVDAVPAVPRRTFA